jgi:SAM-dependent methyltransferase
MPETQHDDIYHHATLYDLAFSYRDYIAEVDFLLAAMAQLGKALPGSVLELGAGPARHALECARRGIKAVALDASAAMVAYGLELARQADLDLNYVQADMRDFALAEPVDLALLMIDSASYLLSQSDFCQHLTTVAAHLRLGGVYILELSHPKDFLTPELSVETNWEMAAGETRVHFQWGETGDVFDPISQTTQVTVKLKAETPHGPVALTDSAAQRCYTYQEILALIALQGDFKLAASYGGFNLEMGLSDPRAWRMILVLERQETGSNA